MHNKYTPIFSIITITYNAEKTIEETLLSVISQAYRHIEYIIIDGASTDSTMSIVNHYKDHITKIVSEKDKGLYDAMNKGLLQATGDYVCFLNSGDSFHSPETLLQIVHSLKGDELPDVIYGDTALVNDERHFVRMRRLSPPETLNWCSFKQGMLVCHQAFIAKRSLTQPYDLKYRFSSDFDWCIRVMKKSHYLYNTHQTLIDYLDEGLTTQNQKASLRERFSIMCYHYGVLSTLLHHAWFMIRSVLKN